MANNGCAMMRMIASAIQLIALAAPVWAGFDEGMAAYKRGDYGPDQKAHIVSGG